jgi:multicomponent K+:H+ antiporter subunit G
MNVPVPFWVDVVTAFVVVVGSIIALLGAAGLWRFKTFFERAHAPALVTTCGVWAFAIATALHFSFSRETVFLHALLIPGFIALTAPITTIFLLRAGLFRARRAGTPGIPARVNGAERE